MLKSLLAEAEAAGLLLPGEAGAFGRHRAAKGAVADE